MEGVGEGKLIIFSLFKLAKRWRGPLGPPILTNFVADCRMASVKKTTTYCSKSLFSEEGLTVQKESYYSGDNSQFNLCHLLGASSCDVLLGTIITKHDGTQPPTQSHHTSGRVQLQH